MMESTKTHTPFKAEGTPQGSEGYRIRRVFGSALLLEALLVALLLALFQAEPIWALFPFTLSGLGSYLLLEPHTDWRLLALSILLVSVLMVIWPLVTG